MSRSWLLILTIVLFLVTYYYFQHNRQCQSQKQAVQDMLDQAMVVNDRLVQQNVQRRLVQQRQRVQQERDQVVAEKQHIHHRWNQLHQQYGQLQRNNSYPPHERQQVATRQPRLPRKVCQVNTISPSTEQTHTYSNYPLRVEGFATAGGWKSISSEANDAWCNKYCDTTPQATQCSTLCKKTGTGNCSKEYEQCGGKGWTGPTCCQSGCGCTAQGEWYSQCVPKSGWKCDMSGTPTPTPVTPTPTSTPTTPTPTTPTPTTPTPTTPTPTTPTPTTPTPTTPTPTTPTPTTPTPTPGGGGKTSVFDINKFYPGINLAGFDWGEQKGINQQSGYQCVSNGIIDWVYNGGKGARMIRFPIAPQYIFSKIPTDKYSDANFNTVFTGKGSPGNSSCTLGGQVYNVGNYLTTLSHATSKGIFSILDVHSNSTHLCAFGPQMQPQTFQDMWTQIAEYVIKYVPNHQYVMFELFNEPVNDGCSPLQGDWNTDYVIPTIKAIRKLEKTLGSVQHVILATTYGNWSGIHAWNDDGTLDKLGRDLQNAGLDSDTSNVLIAGHQYCDVNWSGMHPTGCYLDSFSTSKQNTWVNTTTSTLAQYGLKWIMTEGNITCTPGNPCQNTKLWMNWLNLLANDPKRGCVGFTVWYASSLNTTANSMGSSTQTTQPSWEVYSKFYPVSNNAYDFSGFQPGGGPSPPPTHTPTPTTPTPTTPAPSPPSPGGFHTGDGKASNTYYTAGESKGQGACGGCSWPGGGNGSYSALFNQIQHTVGTDWTLAATSEAMMSPYCPSSVGMGCTGRANPSGPTANAPCGSCWKLQRGSKYINVYVADACPCGNKSKCPTTAGGADNSSWCLAKPGEPNSAGYYNHFDIWNGNDLGFDTGNVTFTNISCPSKLKNIMKQACCDIYSPGQGCPSICGDGYACPP